MQDDESWQMGEVFGDHGWNVIVRPTKPLVGKQTTTTVEPCQTTKRKGTCQNRPVRNFQEVCCMYLINEIDTLNAFRYKHHQGPSINIWHPQTSTPTCEKIPCCFFGWARASKQWNTWLPGRDLNLPPFVAQTIPASGCGPKAAVVGSQLVSNENGINYP